MTVYAVCMFGKKKNKTPQENLTPSTRISDFFNAVAPTGAPADELLSRTPPHKGVPDAQMFVPTNARGVDYIVEMRIREWMLRHRGEEAGNKKSPPPPGSGPK